MGKCDEEWKPEVSATAADSIGDFPEQGEFGFCGLHLSLIPRFGYPFVIFLNLCSCASMDIKFNV